MVSYDYDVIVAGGGPAGAAFASLLLQRAPGTKVLLVDKEKFPRDKPCGDAIGGKALGVLSELGLDGELKTRGFLRSSGIVFSSPSGEEVEIPLAASGKAAVGGFVCRRKEFDSILFGKARTVSETAEGCEVAELLSEGGRVVGVRLRGGKYDGKEKRARLVVGADGANSTVARKAGLLKIIPDHYCSAVRGYYSGIGGLRKNVEIHFLPESMPGYFWIFPLSDHEANVGLGMLLPEINRRKESLDSILEKCLKSPRLRNRFANASLEGKTAGWVLPLASQRRKCAGNGFLLIGDAAALIDPFSGEGVGNAMLSARIAADTVSVALSRGEITEADCLEYEKRLWKEIGEDIKNSFNMQRMGNLPFVLDFFIGKAKRNQQLRSELSGMIADREAKKKASDILFYLRALLS